MTELTELSQRAKRAIEPSSLSSLRSESVLACYLLRASDRAAAVLRRSEQTRFSSANDDEVGGFRSAIRSERSEQSNTVSRRRIEEKRADTLFRQRATTKSAACGAMREQKAK